MASFRGTPGVNDAFGHPGIEPRWTNGQKEGVGTAYSADSPVWIQTLAPFRLHFTMNDWQAAAAGDSVATALGVHYFDIQVRPGQTAPIRFTFFWPQQQCWEGHDYAVAVTQPSPSDSHRP